MLYIIDRVCVCVCVCVCGGGGVQATKENPLNAPLTVRSLWVLGKLGDLPIYYSQVLMGAGLAGRPPYLLQSGPYGCWVSWETSLFTTVRSLWVLG